MGKNGSYRPAVLTVTHTNANPVTYTGEHFSSSAASLGYTVPPTVDKVSDTRYWRINSSDQSNLSNARVRLYYGIGTSDGVTDPANLTVVKTVGAGTSWFDVGGTASGAGSGNILSNSFTSFSDITIANLNGGTNPLPIRLKSFEGKVIGNSIELTWITATETNNDFFTLLRSNDGTEFSCIGEVPGSGTLHEEKNYFWIDEKPSTGFNYYKLQQTDFDGKTTFSRVLGVRKDDGPTPAVLVYPNPAQGVDPKIVLTGFIPNRWF